MEKLVYEFLTNNVDKYPENQVLKDRNNITLTMLELEEITNQIANFLIDLGIEKGDTVALCLDTSTYAAAIVFGVMKSGAIYVPINTQSPTSVIDGILHEVMPKIIIMDESYKSKFNCCSFVEKSTPMFMYNTFEKSVENEQGILNLNDIKKYEGREVINQPYIIPKDLVCIIYTSGTMGKPKGVMCRHENMVPFFHYVSKTFKHDNTFVTMSRSPLSFDPYLTEIIPNMMKGGKVYFYNFTSLSAFIKTIVREKINDFSCPPSIMNILVNNSDYVNRYDMSCVREIWIGYEYCPIISVKKLQKMFPNAKIIHGYGTTETYASSAFYEVETIEDDWKSLPIGKAVDGTELMIINEKGLKALPGELGEMIIRGNSVMPGYWNNLEETKKAFRYNPISINNNEIVYYTGDIFTMDQYGNQFYVGRKGSMVKINGYRVDLTEVQEKILEIESIIECQPLVVSINNIDKIICFIVSQNKKINLVELQQHCKDKLEVYKIPSEFIMLDEIPTNNNGKADVQKLKSQYLEKYVLKG